MESRDLYNNIIGYAYLILVVSSLIIYGLNFGDYKEDSYFCAGYYENTETFTKKGYVTLFYWMEDGLCCNYELNEDHRIIQKCQSEQ